MPHHNARIFCIFAITAFLTSCGGGGNSETGSDATTLSLGLSDAPVDGANAVVVNIQGVHMHSPRGNDIIYHYCEDSVTEIDPGADAEIELQNNSADLQITSELTVEVNSMRSESDAGCSTPISRSINLLELTGGKSVQLLDEIPVEPGHYPWIRLTIDESDPGHIELLDGSIHPLDIPSGAQTGLKLNNGFTATVNGDNSFMIDFDLRKSVNLTGKGYKLRPTLRMVKIDNAAEQKLRGIWAAEDMGRDCASPMAYVYAGVDGIVVDDIGGVNTNPVTTAKFTADDDGTTYSYQVDYIAFGDYTVAYTCDGNLDAADIDDDIEFLLTTTVTVGNYESAVN